MKLGKNLITPHSLVIEKTALELAALYYEAGRSSGLTSKHKDARAFARANVSQFIPKAVELLMDIVSKDSTPQDQRDMILDAFLERSNDTELSNCGLPVFENNTPYLADLPVIYDKPTLDSVLKKVN